MDGYAIKQNKQERILSYNITYILLPEKYFNI